MKTNYLLSKIPIKAKLSKKLSEVARELGCYPGLRLVKKGTGLKYIIGDDGDDRFYLVEFSRESVSLTINSKISPLSYMQEAVLRLLSLLSLLDGAYQVEISSLYPYLINLLSSYQFSQLKDLGGGSDLGRNNGSEIVLAKRINSLLRENMEIGNQLTDKKRKLDFVLYKFILARYGNVVDLDLVQKETQMERKEIENTLKSMEGFGYRAVKIGEGRFSLASI